MRGRDPIVAVLAFAFAGLIAELLLLSHFEEIAQVVALVAVGVAFLATLLVLFRPVAGAWRLFRASMLAVVIVGALGLYFHIEGNAEFELEMRPSLPTGELLKRAMTGATPALAPGSLVPFGLIGLLLGRRRAAEESER